MAAISEYILRIIEEWRAWVGGLSVGLIGLGLNAMPDVKVPAWFWFVVAAVTLFIAQFQAFRKVRDQREKYRIKTITIASLEALSQFFEEGNNGILNRRVATPEEYRTWYADWMTWLTSVGDHIEAHFSLAERRLFTNLVLVTVHPIPGGFDNRHCVERGQCAQMLEKLRSLIIRYTDEARRVTHNER